MNRPTICALTTSLFLLTLIACGEDLQVTAPEQESFTTFSDGLEGWTPLDLGLAAGSSFSVIEENQAARFDIDVAEAGGEGVLAREFVLTPERSYTVFLQFVIGTSDTVDVVEPWTLVVGTSVEQGPWTFNDELTTATPGPIEGSRLIQGSLPVTGGPSDGAGDSGSDIRVAIGFRPETAGQRSYGLDNVNVRFIPDPGS